MISRGLVLLLSLLTIVLLAPETSVQARTNQGGTIYLPMIARVTHPWSATQSMVNPRTGLTANLLPSGKVLVTGGS